MALVGEVAEPAPLVAVEIPGDVFAIVVLPTREPRRFTAAPRTGPGPGRLVATIWSSSSWIGRQLRGL